MLWSLASLGSTPDPAWLAQCMQEVQRRQLQKQMEPQHYGNIGWALAKMGHRCVFFPLLGGLGRVTMSLVWFLKGGSGRALTQ